MVSWRVDPEMTELAKTVFKNEASTVKKQPGQYLLDGTPYGQVEILSLQRKGCFLVAAQSPPQKLPERELPQDVADHLRRNGLRPWKYATAGSVCQVVLDLGAAGGGDGPNARPSWSPFVGPMAPVPQVIGKVRQALVNQLRAMVSATRGGDPLPVLAGPRGVGKHVMAGHVADRLKLVALELPLARLLIPRMLQTSAETLMDMLLSCREHLTGRELLIASDAELLRQLPAAYRGHLCQEIAGLPARVLLLSTEPQMPSGLQAVRLSAVGFQGQEEIAEFLACIMPDADSRCLRSARDMMACGATVPGFGVLPGRLRYLLELVAAWHGQDGTRAAWTPDDVAAAVDLAGRAWAGGARSEDQEM
jgi:hypothetical protein